MAVLPDLSIGPVYNVTPVLNKQPCHVGSDWVMDSWSNGSLSEGQGFWINWLETLLSQILANMCCPLPSGESYIADSGSGLEMMVLGESYADYIRFRAWDDVSRRELCWLGVTSDCVNPWWLCIFWNHVNPWWLFFLRTQTTHHSMSIIISLFIYRATSRLLLDKFLMQMEQCIDRQCDDVQCVPSFSSIMCMSDYEVIGIGFLILSSMN